LSKEGARSRADPADKIEQLINEAKKAKAETDSTRIQRAESEKKRTGGDTETEEEEPALKRTLKKEILVTLTETSKELSRIIGVLKGEQAPPTEAQILPKYCCYCGRDLLPNALYCDRCGASVKGA